MRRYAILMGTGVLLLVGCGGGGGQGPGGHVDTSKAAGGTGGGSAAAGASGGTPGSNTGGAAAVGAGGASGSGGVAEPDAAAPPDSEGSGGGAGLDDAGAGTSSDSGGGVDAPSGGGAMVGFYEAEAIMPAGPNQLLPPAVVNGCPNMSPNCGAPDAIKPETMCCSQGKEVRQLLRGRGGLQFNKIAAPADGMYDVTWYYHCGKNDNFGDGNCGGEPNHPPAGCRPHILTINGTRLPKVYEFHCYPGPWGEIHIVTTPLPLKAGDNSIRVVATPGRDAADLDAIAIFPAGKGAPPIAFSH